MPINPSQKPLVSVVMAVYNASTTLAYAVKSLQEQTYTHWELLCVDDGSTDNSFQCLEKYSQQDARIKVFQQKNSGPAFARALAVGKAKGKYYVQLDSDDRISPQFLERLEKQFSKPEVDFVQCNLYRCDSQLNVVGEGWFAKNGIKEGDRITGLECFKSTLMGWKYSCLGMIKMQLVKNQMIEENIKHSFLNADEYVTRLILQHSNLIVFSSEVYYYTMNKNSITQAVSPQKFEGIIINGKTLELLYQSINVMSSSEIGKIRSYYYKEFLNLLYYWIRVKKGFTADQNRKIQGIFQDYYVHYRVPLKDSFQFNRYGVLDLLLRIVYSLKPITC